MSNDIVEAHSAPLPTLIDRAASALTSAKTSAEVLEARDLASIAYDAAKSAGRMAKAKKAHEEVIAAVYRAQADALLIEARAKMRLADEYDAAQERGEVAGHGGDRGNVGGVNVGPATAADVGLRRDEIHEARKLRGAEQAEPGKAERALAGMLERGEEPTKAKLRKELSGDSPLPAPDPEESKERARIRREFRRLTPQAQEDEFVNVREENWSLRREVRAVRQEMKAERDRRKVVENQTDQGRALGHALRQCDTAKFRLGEEQAKNARQQRRIDKQDAEIKKLREQLERQEITL